MAHGGRAWEQTLRTASKAHKHFLEKKKHDFFIKNIIPDLKCKIQEKVKS